VQEGSYYGISLEEFFKIESEDLKRLPPPASEVSNPLTSAQLETMINQLQFPPCYGQTFLGNNDLLKCPYDQAKSLLQRLLPKTGIMNVSNFGRYTATCVYNELQKLAVQPHSNSPSTTTTTTTATSSSVSSTEISTAVAGASDGANRATETESPPLEAPKAAKGKGKAAKEKSKGPAKNGQEEEGDEDKGEKDGRMGKKERGKKERREGRD